MKISSYSARLVAVAFICCFFIGGCLTGKLQKAKSLSSGEYHSVYDDQSMLVKNGPVLMPYNRFIDPAGALVRFGNPKLENHSLDCVLLPDGKTLAVEDRYGLAIIDVKTQKMISHYDYEKGKKGKGLMSTFSGVKAIQMNDETHIFWSATAPDNNFSEVLNGRWDGSKLLISQTYEFEPAAPAPMALPNDIAIQNEQREYFMYVVLNGNNQLVKIRLRDKKTMWTVNTGMAPYGVVIAAENAYVTNWAGPVPDDSTRETAGIPYAAVYIDHRTGGTLNGTVSVIDVKGGIPVTQIPVGLHPNAIIKSPDEGFVYVANGNSDYVSVINTTTFHVCDSIPVGLSPASNPYIGSSPNALAINKEGNRLYVANGMDNALAVIDLGNKSSSHAGEDKLLGFIPTEAYPAGLALDEQNIYVCNLEGEGSRIEENSQYTVHHQGATVSVIPVPKDAELPGLTARVEKADMLFRTRLSQLLPRPNKKPVPVPERIGEPSLIKHVIYIIKENRTYDQVLGDMQQGNGKSSLCIYGDSITPNQHQLARNFQLLDNYYASGKSSAEGHQWTDAAMTSDYVEKSVRAWFRSYPHVQEDAMVYNKNGFIWNNALDHGRTVRIYGEACKPNWDEKLRWKDLYQLYKDGKPIPFTNTTTISRVRPVLSQNCPCADTHEFADVERADAFIRELKQYENEEDDQWPALMVMALSDDHTAGLRPGIPTPRAMVADNDVAVGKIIDAVSHSRFWKSTAIFITEDDSQDGWDHVSGYRTTGFVVSPYSALQKTIHTNYNQTCMVRTIEQILGLPPMNVIDATALPMFDCFTSHLDTASTKFTFIANKIPLDEMNKDESSIKGKELNYAILSSGHEYDHLDGGNDDLLNRILWFAAKGEVAYPGKRGKAGHKKDDD